MWQRAWFRWSVRVLALVILAALAVLFTVRWFGQRALGDARREFEEKVGSLDPAAYRSRPVPEEENGAVWLLAGARAVVIFSPEREGFRSLAETPSSHWNQSQAELAGRLLERNAPALALLHRSLGGKACDLADAGKGETGYALPFMAAARLLAADSRDALRQGDMDRFFTDAETLRLLASAQERQARLIDLLLGIYAERLSLGIIQDAASAPPLQASDVGRLNALLPTVDLMAALRRTAGHEMAGSMDGIASGTEAEHMGIRLGLVGRLVNWVRGDAECARALQGWIAGIESAKQPYAQRTATPAGEESASDSPYVFDRQGRTAGRLQVALALRQMTALGLEVRKAGLERGAYPADLSAFPNAGSPDPFTGKPVTYTLHSDGSATLAVPGGDALYSKLSSGKVHAVGASWTLPPVRPSILSRPAVGKSSR